MLNNFPRKQTCNSITTTAKRFWQQSITKKESVGFASKFSKDRGNLPLLVSNIAGGSFVLIFAGRKIFFHPDVLVSNDMRKPGINNETITRDDFSNTYRYQTKFFANALSPAAQPIVETLIGHDILPVWELDFTRRTDQTIETPLEFTSHFDDGMFNDVIPHHESTGLKSASI